jgi:hypothetical protein
MGESFSTSWTQAFFPAEHPAIIEQLRQMIGATASHGPAKREARGHKCSGFPEVDLGSCGAHVCTRQGVGSQRSTIRAFPRSLLCVQLAMIGMIDRHHDELPTPRSTLQANYVEVVWCQGRMSAPSAPPEPAEAH